jgi:hypothetical protein
VVWKLRELELPPGTRAPHLYVTIRHPDRHINTDSIQEHNQKQSEHNQNITMHLQTTLSYLFITFSLVAQSLADSAHGTLPEIHLDASGEKVKGEMGRMPTSDDPTRELFFEHQTKPAVRMRQVDVIHELGKENVDFLHMKLSKEISEAMSEKEYERVKRLLFAAFLPNDKYSMLRHTTIHISTIDQKVNYDPSGRFHSDGNSKKSYDGLLNFWIPTMKVMGRPLAFVKSSTLSESQNITNPVHPIINLEYDEANEYIFVPDMKGPGGSEELGDMLVFLPSHVYHGSPELTDHQGDRDAMVFVFIFKRK